MDEVWARQMSALTSAFYREVATSFSATRQAPWAGWTQMLPYLDLDRHRSLTVLDIASGNLRYERFLEGHVNHLEAFCADDCVALSEEGTSTATVHLRMVDVAEALLEGTLAAELGVSCVDQAVSFGFMHHLPTHEQRRRLLQTLVDETRIHGRVACTFWQFASDERIMRRARRAPGGGEGDYLLGWQGSDEVARFCHHTSEAEVDDLLESVFDKARLVARFSADGCAGDLNRYVVLERLR